MATEEEAAIEEITTGSANMATRDNTASGEITAASQEGQPTGFLDLATETRLQIYGYVFSTAHYYSCGTFHEQCHCFLPTTHFRPGPHTHSRISTSILRVNKQILHEALPVMWESVEFELNLPFDLGSRNEETKVIDQSFNS